MSHDRRIVRFVIVSERLSAEELRRIIGAEPDVPSVTRADFFFEATWELRATGAGDVDLSSLIEHVLTRVTSHRDALVSIRTDHDPDLTSKLQVVQYVGDDPVGPGFAIEPNHVALLADLQAFLDVDQYYDG